MNATFSRAAAAAALVFAAPLFTVSALASDDLQEIAQESTAQQTEAPVEDAEGNAEQDNGVAETAAAPAPAENAPASMQVPAEEERICRSIRVDMSSRRKTRVCLTEEGWRELNQQR